MMHWMMKSRTRPGSQAAPDFAGARREKTGSRVSSTLRFFLRAIIREIYFIGFPFSFFIAGHYLRRTRLGRVATFGSSNTSIMLNRRNAGISLHLSSFPLSLSLSLSLSLPLSLSFSLCACVRVYREFQMVPSRVDVARG